MKAYYFSRHSCRLRYGDGRIAEVGVTHTVDRPDDVELCHYGLHASLDVYDALSYAPGCILWEVRLGGKIVEGMDKVVASERTYLRKLDVGAELCEFARRLALSVVHLWDAPKVVVEYLLTGDSTLAESARAHANATLAAARTRAAYYAAFATYSAAAAAQTVAAYSSRASQTVAAYSSRASGAAAEASVEAVTDYFSDYAGAHVRATAMDKVMNRHRAMLKELVDTAFEGAYHE